MDHGANRFEISFEISFDISFDISQIYVQL